MDTIIINYCFIYVSTKFTAVKYQHFICALKQYLSTFYIISSMNHSVPKTGFILFMLNMLRIIFICVVLRPQDRSLAQEVLTHLTAVRSLSPDCVETRARSLGMMGRCLRIVAQQRDPLYPSTLWTEPDTVKDLQSIYYILVMHYSIFNE